MPPRWPSRDLCAWPFTFTHRCGDGALAQLQAHAHAQAGVHEHGGHARRGLQHTERPRPARALDALSALQYLQISSQRVFSQLDE